MEVVRQILDAEELEAIVPLPNSFRNKKVEIIVLPAADEPSVKEPVSVEAVLRELTEAIPDAGMTLEELREERLRKNAAAD